MRPFFFSWTISFLFGRLSLCKLIAQISQGQYYFAQAPRSVSQGHASGRAVKRSGGVGSARHSEFYPESLRWLFSRAAGERRLSNIDGGGSKKERMKERKRKINGASTPSRRVDRTVRDWRGRRGYEIETRRVSVLESIRSARSVPEADRGGDASSIVTNCLVKEGLYVYKDHPPPLLLPLLPNHPPPFCPSVPWLAVTRSTTLERHDDRRVRSILLRESLACLYI